MLQKSSVVAVMALLAALISAQSIVHAEAAKPPRFYPAVASGPIKTRSGMLVGLKQGKITAFLGVPYATPPVGRLRWRPPMAVESWQGERKADRFAPSCMQSSWKNFPEYRPASNSWGPYTKEYFIPGPVSEDCLYLNIWTSDDSIYAKRAVLFWIHGGGFAMGSGSVPTTQGTALARKGLVVVSINYRLGVFGFLAHPELSQESEHASSGNYGLLDMIAALRWVNENIASFGGDPERVTIAGESAGAASVQYLIASPLAKGLFVRAIVESDPGTLATPSLHEAEASGVGVMRAAGASSVAVLRAMTAQQLLAVLEPSPATKPAKNKDDNKNPSAEIFSPWPIVDGWILSGDPDAVIAQGHQNDVSMLAGLNADENAGTPHYSHATPKEFEAAVRTRYGSSADELLKLYPASNEIEATESMQQLSRDRTLAGLYVWACNRSKTSKQPVYTYLFTRAEPSPKLIPINYGAFHGDELPYVFMMLHKAERPFVQRDWDIANKISSYWVNFVKMGNPNSRGLADWPSFSTASNLIMELGDRFRSRPMVDPAKLAAFEAYLSDGGHLSLF